MLAYDPDEAHPLVEAFFADQFRDEAPPELRIDSQDYMFRSAMEQRSGQRDLALLDYFQGGWSVGRLVRRAVHWRFGPASRPRVLDFAAGCGRGTRFLVHDHDPRLVWASDILPTAVSFLSQTLGVHTFLSSTRPEDLVCPQRFDVIVSASLFSHLPRATFVPWLRRLYGLLAPGGLLMVSVHGQDAWAGALDSEGHSFIEASEIDELSTADYGLSQVSEGFMARSIAAASDGEASYRRLPRGLWSYQDVYLITPDGAAEGATPLPSGEPLGYLYGAEHPSGDTRSLHVHGWALDLSGSEVDRIELAINGETIGTAEPGDTLPEISTEYGQPAVAWDMVAENPRGWFDPRNVALVKVISKSGESFVVRVDTLRGLLASEAIAQLRIQTDRVQELERQVGRMQQSRFWKLRDRWWKLRRRLEDR